MNYSNVKSQIESAETKQAAFLLSENTFNNELKAANEKIKNLPLRLKKGIVLRISSGEKLPNCYKGFRVNNTVVILKHLAKNDWKIVSVSRDSVWKNEGVYTTMSIPKENREEIKEKLIAIIEG